MSDGAPALPAAADSVLVGDASPVAADSAVDDLSTVKAAPPDAAATASAVPVDSEPAVAITSGAAVTAASSDQTEPASAETNSEPVYEKEEEPLKVLYCDVCGVPPEYCAYMDEFEKCKLWLAKYHADKVC